MRRLTVLTLLTAGALTLAAPPAMAQEDEVQMEVVQATPDDTGSSVTYEVALTHVDGGDGINGASINAIGTSDTASTSPVTLTPGDEDGIYEGTISFPEPGDWLVRMASADPVASLAVTFTVETPSPATTAAPDPSTNGPPPTSTPIEPQLADDDDGSSGPPIGLVVGLAISGLLMLVVAGTLLIQRRRRGAEV